MKKKIYLLALSVPLILVVFYAILLSFDIESVEPKTLELFNIESKTLDITEGSTVSSVANLLHETKYFSTIDVLAFKLIMKLSFKEDKIYTGRYNLSGIKNVGALVELITSNSGTKITLTFIEGWGIQEYASKLHNAIGIDSVKFTELCRSDYIKEFGINAPSCEGYLYPDTYDFLTSYNEKQIFDRMVNQFLNKYNNFIRNKAELMNMSVNEVVALASIIQGEAAQNSEMNKISSVYHNRLNKGMKLEADPTIQYIIPGGNRRLTYKDLKIISPYNTYLNKGLPPGPINNPSFSALMASINPEKSDYIYFVADTEGGHMFSKTLKGHKNNVRIYKRKRKLKEQK